MVVFAARAFKITKKGSVFFYCIEKSACDIARSFMMNIYITIIFSILGIALGIAIPIICNKVIIYKKRKTNVETIARRFDIKVRVLVAILNGGLWMYAGIRLENTLLAILVSLLFTVTLLISAIDLQIRLIPNELVLLLLCLGIPFQLLYFGWLAVLTSFICMIAVGLMFTLAGKLVGFDQVGAGDVKLAAAMGLVVGYPTIKIALIGMSAALLVFCLGGLAMKKLTTHSTFPFAPFIVFGTICALIYTIDF